MDFNKFFESKWFKRTLIGIAALVVILVVFGGGVWVGYHKARFSYAWGENYDHNFGGPSHGILGLPGGMMPGGMPGGMMGDEFMNSHGTSGTILSIGSSTLAVSGRDGIEVTVTFSSSTLIRAGRDTLSAKDLKVNDKVVVIGSPDNEKGQIEAKLIRVLR